ncbi:MAG: 30S ribosomal protein S9 [Candidatus Micrarchaeota archaeon]|nr:30S ribosomal protein S9 [Candidatus Micrarchaeota archaeon]
MGKIIFATGKRKSAVARAVGRPGTGRIRINKKPLELFPEVERLIISEPLVMAGDTAGKVDIDVTVRGGGVMGQADAVRQAIAKILVSVNSKLKAKFLEYDRSLLIPDVRRNEPHKPSRSKKGPRRHKQRSKR